MRRDEDFFRWLEGDDDALGSEGRKEAHEEGDNGKEGGGMEQGSESGVGKDGGRGKGGEGGQLRREQDRQFEEKTTLTERCSRCGEEKGVHLPFSGMRKAGDSEHLLTYLVCRTSIFKSYE